MSSQIKKSKPGDLESFHSALDTIKVAPESDVLDQENVEEEFVSERVKEFEESLKNNIENYPLEQRKELNQRLSYVRREIFELKQNNPDYEESSEIQKKIGELMVEADAINEILKKDTRDIFVKKEEKLPPQKDKKESKKVLDFIYDKKEKTSTEKSMKEQSVEKPKIVLENIVSKDINIKRDEITQYEEEIRLYESGEKFKSSPSAIDHLHEKIARAENELRELEQQEREKNSIKYDIQIDGQSMDSEKNETFTTNTNQLGYKRFIKTKREESVEKKEFKNETLEDALEKTKSIPEEDKKEKKVESDKSSEPAIEIKTPDPEPIPQKAEPTPKPEFEPELGPESYPENSELDPEQDSETPPPLPEEFFQAYEILDARYAEMKDAREYFITEHQKYLKERRRRSAIGWIKAKLGMEKKQEEDNLPDSLNEARTDYDWAKAEYGRELSRQMKEQGASLSEISVAVYAKVILNEYGLRRQAEAESWTPKEKGVLRKSVEWYMNQNRFTRIAISTGLLTGAVVSTGGFGAVAGGVFFASNYVRGLAAVTAGHLSGLGFEKIFKDKSIEKLDESLDLERQRLLEGVESDDDLSPVDRLHDLESRLDQIYSKAESDRRKRLFAKSAVMLAATLGTSAGLKQLESLYVLAQTNPVVPSSENVPVQEMPKPTVETTQLSDTPVIVVPPETVSSATEVVNNIAPINPFEVSSNTVTITSDANNLWSAIHAKLQTEGMLAQLGASGQQTELVDRVYNVFERMSPEQLKSIGISSGDVQRVMTGSTVDLGEVFGKPELLQDMFNGSSELSSQAIANIEAQGRVISAFQMANPKTMLTPELIKQIVTRAKL